MRQEDKTPEHKAAFQSRFGMDWMSRVTVTKVSDPRLKKPYLKFRVDNRTYHSPLDIYRHLNGQRRRTIQVQFPIRQFLKRSRSNTLSVQQRAFVPLAGQEDVDNRFAKSESFAKPFQGYTSGKLAKLSHKATS